MIKRMLPLLVLIFALTSCQKEPDLGKLSDNLMVYTHYDDNCDFSQYSTYYLPDSILMLDNTIEEPVYYTKKDTRAGYILDAFEDEMDALGYKRTTNKDDADLGLQLTYIKTTNTYIGYDYPYWWYDFYYYWPFSYWDPFYFDWYPYYPYPVSYYSFTVGTLAAEIIALKDIDASSKEKLIPFAWTAYIAGIESSNQINISRALAGVYQAFEQSPYLGK